MKASQKQFESPTAADRFQRFISIAGYTLLFLGLSFFAIRFMIEGSPTLSILVMLGMLYMGWGLYRKRRKQP